MTALDWRVDTSPLPILERPTQPRDARGRFAELPPLPEPETTARYYPVAAPKCEHGHFARWAARHCRACLGTAR